MNSVQCERLLKLIAFLEGLPREKFDFSTVADKRECGTVGCAIGWTPAVFPDLIKWRFLENGEFAGFEFLVSYSVPPGLGPFFDYHQAAEALFGIPSSLAFHLFTPWHQKEVHPELTDLGTHSGPREVAGMLLEFLSLADAGKIPEMIHKPWVRLEEEVVG